MKNIIGILFLALIAGACSQQKTAESNTNEEEATSDLAVLKPRFVTSAVNYDSDDPAIWLNQEDLSQSLILGTDKDTDGGIFVFDLQGNEDTTRRVRNIQRPNNIEITYGVRLGDSLVDIAVFTEREKQQIRVYSLPEMQPLDNGGIPVFEDSEFRAVMGVGLYKPTDTSVQVIVSRKADSLWLDQYLYQYDLIPQDGYFVGKLTRKFGQFSGNEGEIEAICVDQESGYVYYSDELFGVRKYHADPDMGNDQLAAFGLDDFKEDREGISIYKTGSKTGYLLVSNQQANEFLVYPREGKADNPHQHEIIARLKVSTNESDGSEVSHMNFGAPFEKGLFVAMSDDKTFQIYAWKDLLEEIERQQ
ncbi:phytase [Marinoscillum sp.]|uniref:phytase n=1 Tax=Marinoscillum sp. TaxID=2024838 RepID=UPI003BA998AB